MSFTQNAQPIDSITSPLYRRKFSPRRNNDSRYHRDGQDARYHDTQKRPTPKASDLFLPSPEEDTQAASVREQEGRTGRPIAPGQPPRPEEPKPAATTRKRLPRQPREKPQGPDISKLQFKPGDQFAQAEEKLKRLPTEEKVRFMPDVDHLKKHKVIDLDVMKRFHGKWARRCLDRLLELGLIAAVDPQLGL